jgi:hypothetical protein
MPGYVEKVVCLFSYQEYARKSFRRRKASQSKRRRKG